MKITTEATPQKKELGPKYPCLMQDSKNPDFIVMFLTPTEFVYVQNNHCPFNVLRTNSDGLWPIGEPCWVPFHGKVTITLES